VKNGEEQKSLLSNQKVYWLKKIIFLPFRMPFKFIPVSKDKTLAKSSRNLYRSLLNKLSVEEYDTIDKLIAEPKKVIKIIEELYKDKTKRDKRVIVSAIFYILCDTEFIKSPNPYYVYFQSLKEPTYIDKDE
jgi:hypothetical protein